MYLIGRGLNEVHTAGHGGIGVAQGLARKKPSPAALKCAIKQGGYYWFEEDENWALPFHENPEWIPLYNKVGSGRMSAASVARAVKGNREYQKYLASGVTIPDPLKVGDTFKFTSDMSFGRGYQFKVGDMGLVSKVTRDSIIFRSYKYSGLFRLNQRNYEDGLILKTSKSEYDNIAKQYLAKLDKAAGIVAERWTTAKQKLADDPTMGIKVGDIFYSCLREALVKVAQKNPETRVFIVPLLRDSKEDCYG